MNLDKRLLQLLKGNKLSFVFSVLFALLSGLATIAFSWYLSRIIKQVFLQNHPIDQVKPLILWLLLFAICQALSQWAAQAAGAYTAAQIKSGLRRKLANTISAAGPIYLKDERSGELSNTMLAGIEALDVYFSQYIPQLFNALILPLTILFFVFPLDVLSAVILMLTAPLIPVFMVLIGDTAKKKTQQQWVLLSRMSAHFLDVLQGLTTLKIFGKSREQIRIIAEISDRFRQTTMTVLRIAFLSALVLELMATISTAIIAVEIGLRLLYANIDYQQALFILILAPEFYQPLRQLGARFHAGMEGVSAAQRIFNIFGESKPFHKTAKPPRQNLQFREPICFSNVAYTYPGTRQPAIDSINFKMEPESTTALVGSSGAGKTTISNLLLKFMDPGSGSIMIGEIPLSEMDRSQWLQQVAWVAQKPYLFHRSIADNILLARPDAGIEEISEAARRARLDTFIDTLPDGYNTIVGEQGARLSGGQAQRLALARAFLKDAPILILDEPTANLDPNLEAEIASVIRHLTKSKTTLIIAHRLSTIRNAGQILLMSNGRIKETGTHNELMQRNGYYSQLLRAGEGQM